MTGRARLLGVVAALLAAAPACSSGTVTVVDASPECHAGRRLAILAQAVPTAAYVPCIAEQDSPWRFSRLNVEEGRARLSLVYIDPSARTARVELTRHCDTSGSSALLSEPGQTDVRRFRRAPTVSPRLAGVDYAVFDGGCVTTRFDLPRNADASERLLDLDTTVGLYPRHRLSAELERDFDLDLDAAPAATARR